MAAEMAALRGRPALAAGETHSADIPSLFVSKHLLKVEGGVSRMTDRPPAGVKPDRRS